MSRLNINWKLIIVLFIGLIVIAFTGYGLRQWQRGRRAESGLSMGNQAYDQQDWEAAAKHYGRYLAVTQTNVEVLLKYAQAQTNMRPVRRNNIEQAIGAYRTILRVEETNLKAAETLVDLYLQVGLPGEAQLIASRMIAKQPSSDLRRMLAIAMIQQRKFNDASKELKSLLKDHPDYVPAYEELGRLVQKRPDADSQTAQFWFDQAVGNNPSSAAAYIIRGSFYTRQGEKDKALADLQEAQKQDLSDSTIRLRLAEAWIDAGVMDSAKTHLEAVQKLDPTNQALWQIWARFAFESKMEPTMTRVAQEGLKALTQKPEDFLPVAAELYIRSGQTKEAEDCVAKLRQKEIAPATTEYLAAMIAEKKGQHYEAVKRLYRAIELENKSPVIRLQLADILSHLGDKQSAIQQLRILVSENPDFAGARLTLARMLSDSGNWNEASELARSVTDVLPNDINAAIVYNQSQIQILAQNRTDKDSPVWDKIEENLSKLEKETDNKFSIKLLQFQVAVVRSRFDAAGQLLDQIKAAYPSRVEVAIAEIELLTAQNQIEQAMAKLSQTVQEFPDSVSATAYFAGLLADKGQRQKTEEILKEALTRFKDSAARRQLGMLLADYYNRWDQQQQRYEILYSMIQEFPDDIILYSQILQCEKTIRDPQIAQQMLDKIKLLEGDNGYRWRYEQSKIWFLEKDQSRFTAQYPQMVSLLKANLLANPEDQASRMLLAAAYERAGKMQLAISTYLEALDRSPRNMQVIVSAVAALYKSNEYDRADKILEQASLEKLFHPELERLQLQSFIRKGELNSAGAILENLLRNDPNNESICLSLALLKIRQNEFADARVLLDKMKARKPDSVAVAAAQVECSIRQNQPQESLAICDAMVDKLHTTPAYILRARTLAVLGQVPRAMQDLETAIAAEPGSVEALIMRSDIYASIGQTNKAIADIQKVLSLSADNNQIQMRAVSLFLASGDAIQIQQGRVILDKALAASPNNVGLRLFKARYLMAEDSAPAIAEAQELLLAITVERPRMGQAWALLAEIAFKLKQNTKAADIILRGLVYQPNDPVLVMMKAQLEAKSSPLLAIPTLKGLLERNPENIDILLRLAETCMDAADPAQAVALLKTKLTASVSAADQRRLNITLAVALYKNGDKTQSQELFDSLSKSAPDDPAPLLAQVRLFRDEHLWEPLTQKVLAWYQARPGDTNIVLAIVRSLAIQEQPDAVQAAQTMLRAILKQEPGNTEAAGNLAMLLQTMGQPQEAAQLYQRILAAQPDNLVAINNLAWILCEDQQNYKEALEWAQKGIEKAPTDYVDLIDTRGTIYYRTKQFDKAAQDFNQCLKLYPEGTPAKVLSCLHLAKTMIEMGKKEESAQLLRQTLKLNQDFGGLSPADQAQAESLLKELTGEV